MSAPDCIVIAGVPEEYGNYYPSAVEAEGEHGGFAVEYIRKDASDAAIAAARAEGVRVAASLAAAISLLERGGKAAKKAAPSDKMFDQMLIDYRAALDAFRKTYAEAQP